MSRKVLVLNQDFTALSVCSVPKAFLLVYLNKAELVSDLAELRLHTVSASYAMPSIIRLFNYVNLPHRSGVMLNRHNIFRRDGYQCQYCGTTKDLTLDHVLPRSRKGKTSWDNLTTACKSCNARKGDLTPQEAGMLLAQMPFKPSFVMFLRDFSDKIQDDWAIYLGKKNKY